MRTSGPRSAARSTPRASRSACPSSAPCGPASSRSTSSASWKGGGDGAPIAPGDPAEKDVEEAERRGVRLVASAAIRDNFLGMYERRFAKTELSAVQKEALECVAASRCDEQI